MNDFLGQDMKFLFVFLPLRAVLYFGDFAVKKFLIGDKRRYKSRDIKAIVIL